MEALTTIRKMVADNQISVPDYQRAYSWETEIDETKPLKHVNTFLTDLEEFNRSFSRSPYYFGHFLFEDKGDSQYSIIDGQQRLTTIVIFLAALFTQLKTLRALTEKEEEAYEALIRRKSTYRFQTVSYDRLLFNDYVIEQSRKDKKNLRTTSSKRIVKAFDFFQNYLAQKDEAYLTAMLRTVQNASCTTHPVRDEAEAIQMFIFQNNRGKKPTNLEIIKAQFLFQIHLHAGADERNHLIEEVKERFEGIYKSITSIENHINEDDVLVYTMRVYFNSLWENSALQRINELLGGENPLAFIQSFTKALENSFTHLTTLLREDEKDQMAIHSLVTLGSFSIAIPFLIKAYSFGVPIEEIALLCQKLESIILRHRLIGTRADITSRLNDVYKAFTSANPSVQPIIKHIDWMRNVPSPNWWWGYWNQEALAKALQGGLNRTTAKFLLWKYENFLEGKGKNGYSLVRYDKIKSPELEHIAPQTPTNGEPVAAGYPAYDETFKQQYIDCLGNYLLLSKSHNCSLGNQPFAVKRASYTHLAQQREVQEMTELKGQWTKEAIVARQQKIVDFILSTF